MRYRGELAIDLTTPVAHLPDNGALILGAYATVEQPGVAAVGDDAELVDDGEPTAVEPAWQWALVFAAGFDLGTVRARSIDEMARRGILLVEGGPDSHDA